MFTQFNLFNIHQFSILKHIDIPLQKIFLFQNLADAITVNVNIFNELLLCNTLNVY